MYEQYQQDPDSIEPSWKAFFQGYDFGSESYGSTGEIVEGVSTQIPEQVQKEFQVIKLIDGYRTRGHLFTKTNPVRDRRKYQPSLELENFGLSSVDLDTIFNAGEVIGIGPQSLRVIIEHLEAIYCDAIGVEYMYIRKPLERQWIQDKLNKNDNHGSFSSEEKKHILKKLNDAVSFETFLHTKYVGQKRFSLEGSDTLIPLLNILIEQSGEHSMKRICLGMAHRGRLNVLINIMGKRAESLFKEFAGELGLGKNQTGDVKYHQGFSSDIKTSKEDVHLALMFNPSHLELVNPVIEGYARYHQDKIEDAERQQILPVLIHGDAAFSGQGIVMETLNMSQSRGYRTMGTVHICLLYTSPSPRD